MEVLDGEYTAALVWAHWIEGDRVLEVHACAAKKYRGRWMTRETIAHLMKIVDITECRIMLAQLFSPLQARCWKFLGLEIMGDRAILITEHYHGSCEEPLGDADRRPTGAGGHPEGQGGPEASGRD